MSEIPTLTFEPFSDDEKPEAILAEEEKKIEKESVLSKEELKMVDDFASQINLTDSNIILQFGAGAQKKIADFSETALERVKTKDLGEIGDMLSGVVKELKNFDKEEEEKGLKKLFRRPAQKISDMKTKYAKAETNVNHITTALENHQVTLLKDVAMLDKMYELNKTYFKELNMYILAGKKKLDIAKNQELPALIKQSEESGLAEHAQAVNDMNNMINRFEKKLYDLELTKTISLQMAPQIRLIQENDSIMAEKIQSTIVNTIPLWKSQMVLALGVTHAGQAAQAQREVTDMTNALLKKNAETLKMATIDVAKESERGIVDIETLKYTNESLITTLDEVLKIQTEGRQRRQEAEVELNRIENELKQKLLSIRQ
ncbi:toxic anion resistance protein [Vallitaleaceae bacterium 9-2]